MKYLLLSLALLACRAEDTTAEKNDADGDGYDAKDDCNDNDASVFPGAADDVGDDIDQNCDALDGIDGDADGIASLASGGSDCDDNDAAAEASTAGQYYQDADGDGFGNANVLIEACEQPEGATLDASDCDDGDAAVHPDATEVCDAVDNDCDGDIDDDDASLEGAATFYADSDDDGYGNMDEAVSACSMPQGYVEDDADCDDSNASIHPQAEELVANDADDNCDGQELCYVDADADGYGVVDTVLVAGVDCAAEAGASATSDDCDDGDTAINPAAAEVCDTVDNDCDGLVDDADDSWDNTTGMTYYADMDGDGYGDAAAVMMACSQSEMMSDNADDCDDSHAMAYPGAASLDSTTQCMLDADGDGYGASSSTGNVVAGSDCNDASGSVNPLATDVAGDGIDQNCDGIDGIDMDGDGYASTASGGDDCDDADTAINPAAAEVCDTVDNDCDGLVDDDDTLLGAGSQYFMDADGDGYGNASMGAYFCEQPVGYVMDSNDCNDDDATTYPGAAELDSAIDCLSDADGDGYAGATQVCYSIEMTDSWGDGWNGNMLDVYVDGVYQQSLANEDLDGLGNESETQTEQFCFAGETLDIAYVAGTYAEEISFNIYDASGSLVSSGIGTGSGFLSDTIEVAGVTYTSEEVFYSESFSTGSDCDDNDANTNPDAAEVCDDIDNNCDGDVDEGLLSTFYVDNDGDGYGDASQMMMACASENGVSADSTDCDDSDANAYPGAANLDSLEACMVDADGDGYGDSAAVVPVAAGSDCNDAAATINPLATDIAGDGVDQNCDGTDGTDMDGDGDPSIVSGGTDCDDNDASIEELDLDGDGVSTCGGDCFDNDVDTIGDDDGDGYYLCDAIPDCDDNDDSINPDATEVYYDGIDQNCDGANDFDVDGDGEEIASLDCDGDGSLDAECDFDGDGVIDFTAGTDCDDESPYFNTADADGDGFTTCEDSAGFIDCDDEDGATFPGAAELDSTVDCMSDVDSDGLGDIIEEDCYLIELFDSYGDDWNGDSALWLLDSTGTEVWYYAPTSADDCVDDTLCDTAGGYGGTPEGYLSDEICADTELFTLYYTEGDYNEENSIRISSLSSGEEWTFGPRFSDADGVELPELSEGEIFALKPQISSGTDCDDNDTSIGATDVDADGYVACVDDCDDNNADINPGATEIYYDFIDQDCVVEDEFDQDGDGEAIYQLDCDGDGTFETECDFDGDGVADYIAGLDEYDTDPNLISQIPLGGACVLDEDCLSGYCGRATDTCATLSTIYISALDTIYTGNLGGIEGADALCADQAAAYGYSGGWVALLSTSTQDAIARIPDLVLTDGTVLWNLPIYTVNGSDLYSSWIDLANSSQATMNNPVVAFQGIIIEEEYGYSNDADGWTGSNGDGTYYTDQTCSDWTSTSGLGVTTECDINYQLFKVESNRDCGTQFAVQCVQIED